MMPTVFSGTAHRITNRAQDVAEDVRWRPAKARRPSASTASDLRRDRRHARLAHALDGRSAARSGAELASLLTVRFEPKSAGDDDRISSNFPPPIDFIAAAVHFALIISQF
jgi:hypothetical protein